MWRPPNTASLSRNGVLPCLQLFWNVAGTELMGRTAGTSGIDTGLGSLHCFKSRVGLALVLGSAEGTVGLLKVLPCPFRLNIFGPLGVIRQDPDVVFEYFHEAAIDYQNVRGSATPVSE